MSVGLSAYDVRGRDLVDLAAAADRLGFDTLWLGEHVVLPAGYESDHPTHDEAAPQHHTGPIVSPETELLDPLVALGAAAGATTRLRLATGIYLVPLRHPLITARAACTLHDVSDGRFSLGVGAGWLREEFDALDVPFDDRRARLEESIEILRAAWRGGPFAHHGPHFRFERVQVTARPAGIPIILGGNSDRALRRAVRLGDGWFSSGTPGIAEAVRLHGRLQALATEEERSQPFRCYFRVEKLADGVVERYRSEGIDDLVVWADQVWPAGPLTDRRQVLAGAAAVAGLEPTDPR